MECEYQGIPSSTEYGVRGTRYAVRGTRYKVRHPCASSRRQPVYESAKHSPHGVRCVDERLRPFTADDTDVACDFEMVLRLGG